MSLPALEARSPRSNCQQGWSLLRDVRGNLFQTCLLGSHGSLTVDGISWLIDTPPQSLPSSSHAFSLCARTWCPFHSAPGPAGLGACPALV